MENISISNCVRELTKRELEVLEYVVMGLSNKEVASKLGVSKDTIRVYMNKIYLKLNVKNRIQASLWFLKNKYEFVELASDK